MIKADGLAAGKGVIIAADEAQAREALEALLVERRFDTEQVVVEEFLEGEELSLLALCDAQTAVPLASAQDYKTDLRRRSRAEHGRNGLVLAGAGGRRCARPETSARAVHQPVLDELTRRASRSRACSTPD